MNSIELKPLIKKAQEAVGDMPNGDLKTKAFEIVLQKLLEGGVRDGGSTRPAAPVKRLAKAASGAKKPSGPKARIAELQGEGFFKDPKGLQDVQKTLKERGFHYPVTTLAVGLMRLTQERALRRLTDAKKRGYQYTNW